MDKETKERLYQKLMIQLQQAYGDNNKLYLINSALERIENDTYGICQICQEKLPIERLMFNPSVEYCVTCDELYRKTMAKPTKDNIFELEFFKFLKNDLKNKEER